MVGQRAVYERLKIAVDAARIRSEPLGHILLDGPPGLGKTTFATCIPNALNVPLQIASGADIRWLNVNVSNPPKAYPTQGPAPYGAGHCNFTAQSVIGAVEVLDDWVRLGRFPTWAGNVRAFGANSGFAGPVSLPAWPLSPTTQDQ